MYQQKNDRNIHDEIAYANRVENAIIDVKQDKTSLSLSEQYITDRLKIFRLNFIQNTICWKSGKFHAFWKSRDYWKDNCGIYSRNDSS